MFKILKKYNLKNIVFKYLAIKKMIRYYTIQEIIMESLKQYSMNENELSQLKVELNHKSTRELENLLEKLQEENQ